MKWFILRSALDFFVILKIQSIRLMKQFWKKTIRNELKNIGWNNNDIVTNLKIKKSFGNQYFLNSGVFYLGKIFI